MYLNGFVLIWLLLPAHQAFTYICHCIAQFAARSSIVHQVPIAE